MVRQIVLIGLERLGDPDEADLYQGVVCLAREDKGDGRLEWVEIFFPPQFTDAHRELAKNIIAAFTQFLHARYAVLLDDVRVSFGEEEPRRIRIIDDGGAHLLSLYHLLGPERMKGYPPDIDMTPDHLPQEPEVEPRPLPKPKSPPKKPPAPRRPAPKDAEPLPGRVLEPLPHVPLIVDDETRKHLGRVFCAVRFWETLHDDWDLGDLTGGASPCALFFGPSGTGKTQAARRISSETGRSLLIVSHDEILNKYIGDTEKAIDRAFCAAEEQGHLLLFDEADSFLFSRANAIHTWEVTIVNSLLQRMERSRVSTLFTTNLDGILDPAVGRRMLFKVRFGPPGPQARRALWQTLIPKRAPRDPIDFDLLATTELTGGEIKNAILSACIAAADGPGRLTTPLLLDHAKDAASTRLVDVFEEERRRSGRGIGFQPEAVPSPPKGPSVISAGAEPSVTQKKGGAELLPLD